MSVKRYGTLVEAADLAALLGEPAVTIVDCRWDLARPAWGASAYAESHIPGAVFASMDEDLAGPITPSTGRHPLPGVEKFSATLGRWGIDESVQVVAYDQDNGAPAARLWWLLRWLGHSKVAVLNGGFAAWRAAGLPVTNVTGAREPRQFKARVQQGAVVTSSQVAEAMGTRAGRTVDGNESGHREVGAANGAPSAGADPAGASMLLVDARAADRFAGRNETIDPVAGHVPGAVNHPFAKNLDASARFLPPEDLRQRWEQTLAGAKPEQVVAMCGSGVTACHNLLALEVAGLAGARLYAGSWSEWVRDPHRAVAKDT